MCYNCDYLESETTEGRWGQPSALEKLLTMGKLATENLTGTHSLCSVCVHMPVSPHMGEGLFSYVSSRDENHIGKPELQVPYH